MLSSNTPSVDAPVQRDYQEDSGYEDYSDYGDATWAQLNNYSPASDGITKDSLPIQRTPDDIYGGEEPGVDLFQALSQAGMLQSSAGDAPSGDVPIQRSTHSEGLSEETVDLYNAMLQSGMIQDSSQMGARQHRLIRFNARLCQMWSLVPRWMLMKRLHGRVRYQSPRQ